MPTKKVVAPKRSVKKKTVASEQVVPSVLLPLQIEQPKKAVLKKTVGKRASKTKSISKSRKKPEVVVIEEVTLGPDEPLKLPVEVSKEYVVVRRCENCDHIPFSLTKLVTLFSILIVLLSVSVLIQVGAIDISKLIAFAAPVAHAASVFTNR